MPPNSELKGFNMNPAKSVGGGEGWGGDGEEKKHPNFKKPGF